MTPRTPTRTVRTAACAALLVGAGFGLAGWAHRTQAATAMSSIDRLVAEDQIRQKIADYSLLADGDGAQPRDFHALFDQLFAEPTLVQGKSTTREQLYTQSVGQTFDPALDSRHLPISTSFDEITPTTAKTRTTTVYMQVTKNLVGAGCKTAGPDACGGRVVHAVMYVYHDAWAKTPDGWRKTATEEKK